MNNWESSERSSVHARMGIRCFLLLSPIPNSKTFSENASLTFTIERGRLTPEGNLLHVRPAPNSNSPSSNSLIRHQHQSGVDEFSLNGHTLRAFPTYSTLFPLACLSLLLLPNRHYKYQAFLCMYISSPSRREFRVFSRDLKVQMSIVKRVYSPSSRAASRLQIDLNLCQFHSFGIEFNVQL